jgi:hypothetical protein
VNKQERKNINKTVRFEERVNAPHSMAQTFSKGRGKEEKEKKNCEKKQCHIKVFFYYLQSWKLIRKVANTKAIKRPTQIHRNRSRVRLIEFSVMKIAHIYSPCFMCFFLYLFIYFLSSFSTPTDSLKSRDSGLSPEPNYDKSNESGEFLVSYQNIFVSSSPLYAIECSRILSLSTRDPCSRQIPVTFTLLVFTSSSIHPPTNEL